MSEGIMSDSCDSKSTANDSKENKDCASVFVKGAV